MELVGEAGGGGFSDQQGVWATEDEYRNWNAFPSSETPSDSTIRGGTRLFQNRSKATGKMFFKTKLCCKFRAGVCPYITNCNFAHGLEELRKPPPNWQDILAEAPREQQHIPTISTPDSRAEPQRSYKGRHCKKFYTEEGCPYGDNCTFIHDEQSRSRESVAISVTPTVGAGYGNIVNGANQKPSYWKTRICNKWETTGYCPFGSNCHFAHGVAELHNYGGGLVEAEGKDSVAAPPAIKPGGVPMKVTDVAVPSTLSAPHTDVYHMGLGVPVQRSSGIVQRPGQRPLEKWKGPDKISKIYGDWIDDIE